MTSSPSFPPLLEAFFLDRLLREQRASPHTVASYRDTFRLLLRFAHQRLHKAPSALDLEDLAAPFLAEFLDYLETERGNSARSRNHRLAAIHSFFRYIAYQQPQHSALIQRVLALPSKRHVQRQIVFLDRQEVEALLAAPNAKTWTGRRDRVLLLFAVQTGLRVSEITHLRCEDVTLGHGAHVRCEGKGRKQRCTPLQRQVVEALRTWLAERQGEPKDPLFPSIHGSPLSRDGVAYLLAKHTAKAREQCPTLAKKRISPHVLRHTAAMDLLHHGVDTAVIALWLGHESMETTQVYLHADLEIKERALEKTAPRNVPKGRFQPDDELLAFLDRL